MKINITSNTTRRYSCRLVFWIFLIQPLIISGQSDTPQIADSLETVLVKATRIEKPWVNSARSVYSIKPENKEQAAQFSLQEYLVNSPSTFVLNAHNRAQDLRISMRGFGSRAAFGVRGVKIIVDGIPETTADGQGQLDNLNLAIIQRIEILNNGSAGLYGNASGGVINIQTTDEKGFVDKDQFLDLGAGFHSFAGQQYSLTAGKKWGNTSLILHTNHHQAHGYREHSAFESTNFNARLIHKLSEWSKIEAIINYMNSPAAEDPGGVDATVYTNEPTTARERNVQFAAGESIDQGKASLRYTSAIGEQLNLNTYGFYSHRNFSGRLPFTFGGMIELQRNFFGHGASLTSSHRRDNLRNVIHFGYELSAQLDDRQRFENFDGTRGATTLNQEESFLNAGIYLINDLTLGKWTFNTSLRYDLNQIEAEDKLLSNGDDSGSIDLNDLNYSVGVAYQFSTAKRIFINYSTSFETPTLNELSNNPEGGGFNMELMAQFANHLELGVKGLILEKSMFQLSAFFIDSKHELLPYELESSPGRIFYRNTGNTDRWGAELYLRHQLQKSWTLSTSWSYNHFVFSDYILGGENLDGNFLPGIPDFQGNIQLDFEVLKKLRCHIQNQFIGKIFTNNSNSEFQKTKSILNISVKYSFEKEHFGLHPYLGINNILRSRFADNIRINAFGNRYYEAAPDQFVFGGIRFSF